MAENEGQGGKEEEEEKKKTAITSFSSTRLASLRCRPAKSVDTTFPALYLFFFFTTDSNHAMIQRAAEECIDESVYEGRKRRE